MRLTQRAPTALAVLVALSIAIVAGCGRPAGGGTTATPPSVPPAGARPDITGVVRTLTQGDGGLVLLVVADAGASGGVDRASVRVTSATTVWAPAGEGRTALSASDLHAGQRIAVWFTGPVAESYPVQAAAGAIQVLSPT
jgi:hypothetical protein